MYGENDERVRKGVFWFACLLGLFQAHRFVVNALGVKVFAWQQFHEQSILPEVAKLPLNERLLLILTE